MQWHAGSRQKSSGNATKTTWHDEPEVHLVVASPSRSKSRPSFPPAIGARQLYADPPAWTCNDAGQLAPPSVDRLIVMLVRAGPVGCEKNMVLESTWVEARPPWQLMPSSAVSSAVGASGGAGRWRRRPQGMRWSRVSRLRWESWFDGSSCWGHKTDVCRCHGQQQKWDGDVRSGKIKHTRGNHVELELEGGIRTSNGRPRLAAILR